MNRFAILAVAAMTLSPAAADEIRRAAIPSVMQGTWAETPEQCAAKDKSNVSIESVKYGDGSGTCAVRWVVSTPSPNGTNYAVHALCTSAKDQSKTRAVNIIIRPVGEDRVSMGRSFSQLKSYQRCPAG
jgi:hypothetical protein